MTSSDYDPKRSGCQEWKVSGELSAGENNRAFSGYPQNDNA